MDELLELVKVVNMHQLSKMKILGDPRVETNINQLYLKLHHSKDINEDDLATEVFGLEASSKRFKQLKSDLKSRLVNQLFLNESTSTKFTSYSESHDTCLKLYTASQLLYTKGAKKASIQISEKAFKVAKKFDLGSLGYQILLHLRYAYHVSANLKKIQWVKNELTVFKEKFEKEVEVREYFLLVSELEIFQYKENIKMPPIGEEELLRLVDGEVTPSIILFGFNALNKIALYQSNYADAISYSKKAIEKLKGFDFLPNIFIIANYVNILNVAKVIFDFKEVDYLLDEIHTVLDKIKGDNALVIEKSILDFAIVSNNYEVGLNSLSRILNNKRLQKFNKNFKEELELSVIYLHLLSEFNLIADVEKRIPVPKIGKFLNTASEIKKDKTGYNTAFLILQTIYFLFRKDYDEVIEGLRKLQAYTYRYLRKDQSYRTQCFIKMLQTLPEAQFHKRGVERKAKKWLTKLNDSSIANEQSRGTNNEIVPFQIQWEFVLNCLDTKFKYGNFSKRN